MEQRTLDARGVLWTKRTSHCQDCTHLFARNTKYVIGSNTIHLGSSGKGDGESISVGDTLVDDKEGSDADAGSHGDSAPHHLES